jgi:hypothetical protein
MLVAAFYDSAFGREFAFRLRTSVESLGIKCRIFDRMAKLSLRAKSGWKPEALLETLSAYPGEGVFLVDPDSVLNRRPDILLDERDFDLALHYDVESLVPSGPIFVRNSDRGRKLLRSWQEVIRKDPETSDLDNLTQVFSDRRSPLEVRRLPVTYAWVERIHRRRHPSARPVLTHFRADGSISTRLKVLR